MPGNLIRGFTYAAVIKNGPIKTRLAMYEIDKLEDESLPEHSIEPELVEWDAKKYEVSHVNYIQMNGKCFFLFGYVGGYEIFNEKCDKKYASNVAEDKGKFESKLMETAVTSSCVSYKMNNGKMEEVLMMGTSQGSIAPVAITINNTVVPKPEWRVNMSDPNQVVTALQADARLPDILVAGTCQG